jgi:hypothetical protein
VMQFLAHRAHAASVKAQTGEGSAPCRMASEGRSEAPQGLFGCWIPADGAGIYGGRAYCMRYNGYS